MSNCHDVTRLALDSLLVRAARLRERQRLKNHDSEHRLSQVRSRLALRCPLLCILLTLNVYDIPTAAAACGTGRSWWVGNEIVYEWEIPTRCGPVTRSISIEVKAGREAVQRTYRSLSHDYSYGPEWFVAHDPNVSAAMPVLIALLRNVWDELNSYSWVKDCRVDEVALVASFVQAFPYRRGGSYQKYAVECLLDGQGDCSDKAVLAGAIFKAWGMSLDPVFVQMDLQDGTAHLSLWVRYGRLDIPRYFYNNKSYCFMDVVCEGWELGSNPFQQEEKDRGRYTLTPVP